MSVNAIEKALWQISMNPSDARRLREDAQSYLKSFRIDEEERSLLAAWDVGGMLTHGVHPMLVMMAFTAINGPAAMGGYIEKLNRPSQGGPSR
jgi:hypothetical protein